MNYFDGKRCFCNGRLVKSSLIVLFVFITETTYADNKVDDGLLDAPPLTEREKCEIDRSWPPTKADKPVPLHCKRVQLFKPLKLLHSSDDSQILELKLLSQTNDEWAFPDLIIKAEPLQGHLKAIDFSLGGVNYDLSEYTPLEKYGYREIAIGSIDDIIVLQLSGKSITQFFIVPHPCENEDVDFRVKQVFSWYPPLQGDSYHKTNFTTPYCN